MDCTESAAEGACPAAGVFIMGVSFRNVLIVLSLSLLMFSCARLGNYAAKRSDVHAYRIIEEKQKEALGKASPFTIEPDVGETASRVLSEAPRLDWALDTFTTPTYLISLGDALAIAVSNNREYKSRKESFYSEALDLIETRREYQFLFTSSASGSLTRTEEGNAAGAEPTVEKFGSRGFTLGVSKILATGAKVSMDLSHSFTRYFTGEPRAGATNNLTIAATQPLLRGAGSLVAMESLRQGERGMIYAVRDFRRYQQDFIISVADRYYALLRAQDQLANARKNYKSSLDNYRQIEMLTRGGKKTPIEVDQAQQELLTAENQISRVLRDYGRQLDDFKIFLGLPIDLDIGPDPAELRAVAERGLIRPDMTLADAVKSALENRLDYMTACDRKDDSDRAVKIALNNLLPNLTVGYNYSTATADEKDRVRLDFKDHTHQGTLSLGDLFDWTPRRNSYRRALIANEQSRRSFELFREQLIMEVRDSWRELEESRNSYRIMLESVRLAERRVKNAYMFLQSGRSTARDLLEAENQLLASRNSLTDALIRHTLQRLRFWNAIEKLEIDDNGMWVENQ